MFGWLDRLTLRLFLAQGADVATFLCFYLLVGPSVHAERNPLILGVDGARGLAAVGLFKMLITLIVIYRYRRPTRDPPPLVRAGADDRDLGGDRVRDRRRRVQPRGDHQRPRLSRRGSARRRLAASSPSSSPASARGRTVVGQDEVDDDASAWRR